MAIKGLGGRKAAWEDPSYGKSSGSTALGGQLFRGGSSVYIADWMKDVTKKGGTALEKLVKEYNRAFTSAKGANEARYQELLGLSRQDYQRTKGIQEQMLGVAEQTTGQRAADIRSGGAVEESNVQQRLRQLGMSGTTIAPTLRAGVRRETESSLNRLADTMQGTKLGIMQQQAAHNRKFGLGIMERRTDEYPDASSIATLANQLGGLPGGSISGLGTMKLG